MIKVTNCYFQLSRDSEPVMLVNPDQEFESLQSAVEYLMGTIKIETPSTEGKPMLEVIYEKS